MRISMSARVRIFKMKRFMKRAYVAAKRRVVNFVRGIYRHTEAIVILILASLGLNARLGEGPFYWLLPPWIEAPLVIPVLAVLGISWLVKSA